MLKDLFIRSSGVPACATLLSQLDPATEAKTWKRFVGLLRFMSSSWILHVDLTRYIFSFLHRHEARGVPLVDKSFLRAVADPSFRFRMLVVQCHVSTSAATIPVLYHAEDTLLAAVSRAKQQYPDAAAQSPSFPMQELVRQVRVAQAEGRFLVATPNAAQWASFSHGHSTPGFSLTALLSAVGLEGDTASESADILMRVNYALLREMLSDLQLQIVWPSTILPSQIQGIRRLDFTSVVAKSASVCASGQTLLSSVVDKLEAPWELDLTDFTFQEVHKIHRELGDFLSQ